jgi:ABC-type uncharacterized transport system YnjBCD substrate-binding protein
VSLKGKTMLNRRHLLAAAFLPILGRTSYAADWAAIETEAKGQTVYFNAWAGSDTINAYIAWAGEEVKKRYGVTVSHTKITDTAEVVKRVRDEVAAGKTDGSVDLVWINGENFRAMKTDKLLFGPWSESTPNFALVDTEGKPTTKQDFSEAVEGLESPWGMAQLTFFADGAKVANPPPPIRAASAIQPHQISMAPPSSSKCSMKVQVILRCLPWQPMRKSSVPMNPCWPQPLMPCTNPCGATASSFQRRKPT